MMQDMLHIHWVHRGDMAVTTSSTQSSEAFKCCCQLNEKFAQNYDR